MTHKVDAVIANDPNNTEAIESTIDVLRKATEPASTSGDLKAATTLLKDLARSRDRIQGVEISSKEIVVSGSQ